ncbi:hypothetical protein DFH07DRAFT_812405 [Mycena maculata]|uniref:Uncharacterized protein n=1 Tax=Mycena maculata TaxID=230809 RepID=A0AAD7JGT0_9AGAR|nr:hypothetical protein DFH07DRAFT_812405 [Mycena maculata]
MAVVLLRTIPHLLSTVLITITVIDVWFYGQAEDMDGTVNLWHTIDWGFADPKFVGLKDLELMISQHNNQQWFLEELPKHTTRGCSTETGCSSTGPRRNIPTYLPCH